MGADVRIEHEDRPEADEGEGVAEERCPAHDGDDIVGQAHRQRGQKEAHDPVPVKPGEDAVGHAGDGAGPRVPDGIAEEIDEKGKDQRAEGVPDGDIEKLLLRGPRRS